MHGTARWVEKAMQAVQLGYGRGSEQELLLPGAEKRACRQYKGSPEDTRSKKSYCLEPRKGHAGSIKAHRKRLGARKATAWSREKDMQEVQKNRGRVPERKKLLPEAGKSVCRQYLIATKE